MRFKDPKAQRAFLFDPHLAFAEAYMDGRVEMEAGSIYDVLSLFAKNLGQGDFPYWMRLADSLRRRTRFARQSNDPSKSKQNVSHHYDLPSSLYELFLDMDRQYSCAYFEKGTETLDEAQLAKKRHIAKKLCLKPGQRVLDIGCGWGGLSLHLAKENGAKVLGITLSDEQERHACARAAKTGADVSFRLLDYRLVEDTFDRIVSVGMFEHVGLPNYLTFFKTINSCLKSDGVALLHTIGRLSGPGFTHPFIAKYIFPGGYVPALSEILPAIEEAGLLVTDIEVLRLHYAQHSRCVAQKLRKRLGQGGRHDVRTVLPDVGLLSRRLRGQLPLSKPRCVPDSACKTGRCRAAHTRLPLFARGSRTGLTSIMAFKAIVSFTSHSGRLPSIDKGGTP